MITDNRLKVKIYIKPELRDSLVFMLIIVTKQVFLFNGILVGDSANCSTIAQFRLKI